MRYYGIVSLSILGLSALWVLPAFGRPADPAKPAASTPGARFQGPDPTRAVPDQGHAGWTQPVEPEEGGPVLRTASGSIPSPVTWFGYVNGIDGSAVEGETWTFDRYNGNDYFEGWTGKDLTTDDFIAGRRITPAEWSARGNSGIAPTFAGSAGGLWIGFFEGEADSSCFLDGAGYGNNWNQEIRSPVFTVFSTTIVAVEGYVFNDTEPGYDSTRLLLRDLTSGTEETLHVWTGVVGTPSSMQEFIETGSIDFGHDYQVVFQFTSDAAWSDQDSLYTTTAGAFAVDNILIYDPPRGVDIEATFDTDADGFTFHATDGVGTQATTDYYFDYGQSCLTNLRVLAFSGAGQTHTQGKSEILLSPPVGLATFGSNPNILAHVPRYLDLPCLDGVLYGIGFSYYPCGAGQDRWSDPAFENVYYASEITCGTKRQLDAHSGADLVPAGADSVRLALWVLQDCSFAALCPGTCTGVSDFSPLFDDIRLGVMSSSVLPVPSTLYPTIQSAIDSAASGDTVLCADGTYTGAGNKNLDFGGKNLVLLSEGGGAILDCEGSGGGFIFDGGETSASVVCGFSVINGNGATGSGAKIFYSSPVFQDCTFAADTTDQGVVWIYGTSATPSFSNCEIRDNVVGSGTVTVLNGAAPSFMDCLIQGNQATSNGAGADLSFAGDSTRFTRCQIVDNASGGFGGGIRANSGVLEFRECIISGNQSDLGGGLYVSNSTVTLIACSIETNTSVVSGGGGMRLFGSSGAASLVDTKIRGNDAWISGGGIYNSGMNLFMQGCVIAGNAAGSSGGGVYVSAAELTMLECTVAGNLSGALGGGLYTASALTASLDRCIVWGNCGSSSSWDNIYASSTALEVTCSAVAPTGVDATPNYDADTIFEDPQFCGASVCSSAPTTGGEYTLALGSPCRAVNSACGQRIGALGSGGCFGPSPWLSTVTDVPNDQGREVRLTWNRTSHDAEGAPTVTGYGIYRRIDPLSAPGLLPSASKDPKAPQRAVELLPPGSWDYVATVPARGDGEYSTVVATLCDSTLSGVCNSTFFVSALTPDPLTYFDSTIRTGYSVDNLSPSAPNNLVMDGSGRLTWDEAPEPDFDHFTVYGSNAPTLDGSAQVLGHTTGTDYEASQAGHAYFFVTATDFAGNEGDEASVMNTVSVPGAVMPTAFALHTARPNPFRTSTGFTFDLPEAAGVRLEIFDVQGRKIRTLVDGRHGPGRHTATWDGVDEAGRRAAPGIYFIHFNAGTFADTDKSILVR